MTDSLTLYLLILFLVLLLAAVMVWVWSQFNKQQAQLQVFTAQLESVQQHKASLQTEIEELRAGVIGVGQRVLVIQEQQQRLQQALAELQEQQQALALSDPESKIYSRAVKMVELGADLEEIIRECELPRAEAELLFNLHRQKRS
jgi:septal ring factor EnvC (AmiA/AmiB activator)